MVEYIEFKSIDKRILSNSKKLLSQKCNVWIFGILNKFIGWEVEQWDEMVLIIQRINVKEMIKKYGILTWNGS